jgi:hypothetical protein
MAFAASVSTSQATLVTFDLRSPSTGGLTPTDEVISDRGTKLQVTSFWGGIPQANYVVSPDGSGPVLGFDPQLGRNIGYFPGVNLASTNNYQVTFSFDHPVQLASADFLLLNPVSSGVEIIVDGDNIYRLLDWDEFKPLPQALTLTYSNLPLVSSISMRNLGGQDSAFSLASLRVRDATVSSVPDGGSTLAIFSLGLFGVAGLRRFLA